MNNTQVCTASENVIISSEQKLLERERESETKRQENAGWIGVGSGREGERRIERQHLIYLYDLFTCELNEQRQRQIIKADMDCCPCLQLVSSVKYPPNIPALCLTRCSCLLRIIDCVCVTTPHTDNGKLVPSCRPTCLYCFIPLFIACLHIKFGSVIPLWNAY